MQDRVPALDWASLPLDQAREVGHELGQNWVSPQALAPVAACIQARVFDQSRDPGPVLEHHLIPQSVPGSHAAPVLIDIERVGITMAYQVLENHL